MDDPIDTHHHPVGQLKQLGLFRGCPVTDLAFKSCYSNIS